MKAKNLLLIIAIALLFLILAWILLAVPELTKIPADFRYKIPILSIDNFYNPEKQDFGGEFYSKTKFSYEVVEKKDGLLIIKNTFDVRKYTGEKIFSVERLYGIDPRTGKHVPGYGDKDREGYLFAPKGLKKGEPFTYWHINYDAPANMEFKEEQTMNGLTLYRYETNYHADQTENLGHLPGVPEERGVVLDINLQLWVEPETGRMIRYEDKTIAYYYNQSTGERIHPWNKFNNKYNEISIMHQIEAAQSEKSRLFILKYIIPLLLGLIAAVLLAIAVLRYKA